MDDATQRENGDAGILFEYAGRDDFPAFRIVGHKVRPTGPYRTQIKKDGEWQDTETPPKAALDLIEIFPEAYDGFSKAVIDKIASVVRNQLPLADTWLTMGLRLHEVNEMASDAFAGAYRSTKEAELTDCYIEDPQSTADVLSDGMFVFRVKIDRSR